MDASTPTITMNTSPNITATRLKADGLEVQFERGNAVSTFSGKVENRILPTVIKNFSGIKERLLLDAVNNRTRERNYYQLYSQLLENNITDDEFDRELDTHPDDYVVPTFKIPSELELHEALAMAKDIKGVDSMGDLEALFSFNSVETSVFCKKLINGSL